jgi:hypothetical protein
MISEILPVKYYNGIMCACGILHILFALINTNTGAAGRGACVGRGEQLRIKVDRAGCACEVSHVYAWALRQDRCACGV